MAMGLEQVVRVSEGVREMERVRRKLGYFVQNALQIMQTLSARFKLAKTAKSEDTEERDVKRLDLDMSVMSIHDE